MKFYLGVVVAAVLFMAAGDEAAAQQKVEVKGSSTTWTKVAAVPMNTTFTIQAEGTVDFGGVGHKDSANAGVTGAAQRFKDVARILGPHLWTGDIKALIASFAAAANKKQAHQFLHEVVRTAFKPNYEQGGVWIRITDSSGNNPIPTNLWYYWNNIFNKSGGIRFTDTAVTVWAKTHDGGDNPESTSSYGDNKGSYKVWIETSTQMTKLNLGKETDLVPYQIVVRTGSANGAGTDANVYIQLLGDKAETAPTYLGNASNNFEKGQIDTFDINYPGDLGNIKKIVIGHDNKGDKPGWYLASVTITHKKSNKAWNFTCNRWLAKDEDDRKIERSFP